jgi:hypothetical protein
VQQAAAAGGDPAADLGPHHPLDSHAQAAVGPAVLMWSGLTVTVKRTGKVLLHAISGGYVSQHDRPPADKSTRAESLLTSRLWACRITGGYWGIIGPSGGGKTTLLNALSFRLDQGVTMEGRLRCAAHL